MRRTIGFLLLLGSCWGCSIDGLRKVEARDRDVVMPTGRISIPLEFGGEYGRGHLDAGFSRGVGKGDMSLASGDFIFLDFEQVDGPATVEVDYDINFGFVAFRPGVRLGDLPIFLEPIMGFGYQLIDVNAASATQRSSQSLDGFGSMWGLQVAWEPFDEVEFAARRFVAPAHEGFQIYRFFSIETELDATEVEVVLSPWENIGIIGGWRWWDYNADPFGSRIDLKLSGPMVGIEFRF